MRNLRRQTLRVVHVSVDLDLGGMEKLLVEFARHADPGRFNLRFISLTGAGRAAGEIESLGLPVTALQQPPGARPGLVFRLAALFRDHAADIIHTHNTKPLLYAGPAARLAGARAVIHTRHGQRLGASGRQNALFNLAARCADAIVSVSQDSTRLAARDGVPAEKLCTIHNGIDLARFNVTGPDPDGPAVFVGRLSQEKEIETLLRAAGLVRRREPSFRLEIAGDGPCRPGLERLAAELGLQAHVHFRGRVADVASLLSRARLFVLPSLTEGIALTLLEAMACGVPTVATRVGGNPEVVVEGATGLLVPPRDAEALAAAMLQLWVDPQRARRMGAAGRERAQQRFNVQRMVGAYESLYLQALADRRCVAWPA